MNLEEYTQRFKSLKKKSVETSLENRKIADKELKEVSLKVKPRVYSMKETAETDDSLVVDDATKKRTKILNYNMKQYEEWEQRQRDKKVKADGADLQEIAKYSYEKELKRLNRDARGENRVLKVDKDDKTGKLKIFDDKRLVHQLAGDIKKTTMERYMARKKEMERADSRNVPGGYINEKNKQFNEKLDRQSKKTDD